MRLQDNDPPKCGPFGDPSAAVISDDKPGCGDGKLLGPWKDADGIDRYACLWMPKTESANSKLPMIVYLHPSLFGAGWTTQTNILDLQNTVSLSDDPKKVGYIVLAPEGRNTTHYYPYPDNSGIGWDNWYRQLNPAGDVKIGNSTWRENADAATIDHFIAAEVATGQVETNRIYISGWSNGAAMGILYAVNRPNIAAAAVYSAPDPFGAFDDTCQQRPVATPPTDNKDIQIFNPSRANDACPQQLRRWRHLSQRPANGERLERGRSRGRRRDARRSPTACEFVHRLMRHRSEGARKINRHCDGSDSRSGQSHAMAERMDDCDAGFLSPASPEDCAVGK